MENPCYHHEKYIEKLETHNDKLLEALKKIIKSCNRDDMETIEAITEAEKLIATFKY